MARYVHRHAIDTHDLSGDIDRIVAAFADEGHYISRADAMAAWRELSAFYARSWLTVGDMEPYYIRRALACYLEEEP